MAIDKNAMTFEQALPMLKKEFLQGVAEYAVRIFQQGDLEEWLCEWKSDRLEKAMQLYPEAKGWTPDVVAEKIKKDLIDHMHGVWETLFE